MEMAFRPGLSGPDGHKKLCKARRKVVAIVDDDPSMLRATKELLDAQGFLTAVFPSAEEFLASNLVPDADYLLLDIHLPWHIRH